MSQVIPTYLAITFICVFAWGVGLFLTSFAEKVTAEIDRSQASLSVKLDIPKKELHNFKKQ